MVANIYREIENWEMRNEGDTREYVMVRLCGEIVGVSVEWHVYHFKQTLNAEYSMILMSVVYQMPEEDVLVNNKKQRHYQCDVQWFLNDCSRDIGILGRKG